MTPPPPQPPPPGSHPASDSAAAPLPGPRPLVVLFGATAGALGPDLGSDETDLILLVWQVVEPRSRQVGTLHKSLVRAEAAALSPQCREASGLSADSLARAEPLDKVLQQFSQLVSGDVALLGGGPYVLCTDGQQLLRQVLHPEASRKNLVLPDTFFSFYDLRREFHVQHPSSRRARDLTVATMAQDLGLETDATEDDFGVWEVKTMVAVILHLIEGPSGQLFSKPEVVKQKYETGPCSKADVVDSETVVRARGLPWQSSDQDVARFFKGLNIARGGVALCLNAQGRRNGEALIHFVDSEQRDLALQRHKHHMGVRYIEVYKATGEEFVKIAGGTSLEVARFLSREDQVILRLRGLGMSPPPCKLPCLSPPAFATFQATPTLIPTETAALYSSSALLPAARVPAAPTPVAYYPGPATQLYMNYTAYYPSPPVSPTTVGYLTTPPAALASAPTSVLSQPGALVRMQGVPYTAGVKDLLSVFQAYQLAPDDYTSLMPVGDPPRTVLQAPKEWVCL
uniref:Epithelial splicing regulatory protein 2 n=1 Tax=Equus asinus asinus TaxID=83772 RepID=A0A8C4MTB0_EQUAS